MLSTCVCLCVQEHKLIRNQSVVGSKLPDLSEAAEQEKGNSPRLPSCSRKTQSALAAQNVAKGVHFLNLRENLFQSENDDDLFLCVFFLCATHLLATT